MKARSRLRLGERARLSALLLAFPLFGTIAVAAEHGFSIPQGWSLELTSSPYALSPTGGAVAAYKFLSEPAPGSHPYDRSLVIQAVNGEVASQVEFDGPVARLEYSPDGQMLLVHQFPPESPSGVVRITALSPSGAVLWTRDDTSAFQFSTTGEAIYTLGAPGPAGQRSGVIRLFDLSGEPVKEFKVDSSIQGAVAVGNGDQLIVAVGRSLLATTTSTPPEVSWTIVLEPQDQSIRDVEALDATRLVVKQSWGHFMIVTTSGEIVFRYLPAVLAENDPERSVPEYGSYVPFALPGRSELLLFNESTRGFLLDVAADTLTPVVINARGATGTATRESLGRHGRIVLMTADRVTFRDVGY